VCSYLPTGLQQADRPPSKRVSAVASATQTAQAVVADLFNHCCRSSLNGSSTVRSYVALFARTSLETAHQPRRPTHVSRLYPVNPEIQGHLIENLALSMIIDSAPRVFLVSAIR
jgi:hypothetical protein